MNANVLMSLYESNKSLGHSDHDAQQNASVEYARRKGERVERARSALREALRQSKHGNRTVL
jgi:hypothetical protein